MFALQTNKYFSQFCFYGCSVTLSVFWLTSVVLFSFILTVLTSHCRVCLNYTDGWSYFNKYTLSVLWGHVHCVGQCVGQ